MKTRKKLVEIMVIQLLRGKQGRKYMKKLYDDNLSSITDRLKDLIDASDFEIKNLLQAYRDDEYYFKRTAMDTALNRKLVENITRIIYQRYLIIYRLKGDMEFVTSDNPVMFIDSATLNSDPFSNGLKGTSTIIYYPISPKILVSIIHPLVFYKIHADKDCIVVDIDSIEKKDFINTINKKQIEQSFQQAYARSDKYLQ